MNGHSYTGSGVVVLGGVNQDTSVRVPWLPLPGETVISTGLQRNLGGKAANQAVAVARSGVTVSLLAALGDDAAGDNCLRLLAQSGVDVRDVVRLEEVPTGQASVWVDNGGQNSIVVTPAANGLLDVDELPRFEAAIAGAAVLVVQGEVSPAVSAAAVLHAYSHSTRAVVNLAPYVDLGKSVAFADPLVVNEVEAAQLLGVEAITDPRVAVVQLSKISRTVVMTVGAAGAYVVQSRKAYHVPAAHTESVVDTTGAGDAFVGVLAASLSVGIDLMEATKRAVAAATASTQVHGAGSNYPLFPPVLADEVSA
ncbi:ribokinase [Clavibacter michiganensis subsp. phaseoli]|uniref:Ribokinase n=1 Tax=Clavibacter phaseoli TaxID=1734031 RepID=A0A8I0SBT0_9MICO|nr:ribokinase [Clavibacter phaseoli]MBF4632723.1 ribokinase [Clavibacter phaseoli]